MFIPLGIGIITRLLASYGPESVAAFGVATRIEFFAMTAVMSLATVLGPFVGQNWGAKLYKRVLIALKLSNRFSIYWGLFIVLLLAFLARPIASLFNDNPNVISTVVLYLRIAPLGFSFYGILLLAASVLNVLHRPLHSAGLSIFQIFILYIPLAILGSHLWGVKGIFWAYVFSYILSSFLAHTVLKRVILREKNKTLGYLKDTTVIK